MADLDEDAVIGHEVGDAETDIADETQDFRFLNSLSQASTSQQALPRRGEKDFEQHGTRSQQSVLAESRLAMYNALSYTRTHNPRVTLSGSFDPVKGECIIDHPAGQHFKSMGRQDAQGIMRLLPEETLYLVERGTLYLKWTGVEELEGLPVSLQSAYTYLIGQLGLSLERYTVYAGLRRSGYMVQRAPTWYPEDHDLVELAPRKNTGAVELGSDKSYISSLFTIWTSLFPSLWSTSLDSVDWSAQGLLVHAGLYRSYRPIYQQLALIRGHDPSAPTPREQRTSSVNTRYLPETASDPPFDRIRPAFNVWKPTHQNFKKSSPPPPDFHIAVVDAQQDPFPSLDQLDDLLQCMPYSPPPPSSFNSNGPSNANQLYSRLRHGYRHVIFAVVDQGVVSYVRIGDAGFGLERVYEREGGGKRAGSKGGGGWKKGHVGGNQGKRTQGGRGKSRA